LEEWRTQLLFNGFASQQQIDEIRRLLPNINQALTLAVADVRSLNTALRKNRRVLTADQIVTWKRVNRWFGGSDATTERTMDPAFVKVVLNVLLKTQLFLQSRPLTIVSGNSSARGWITEPTTIILGPRFWSETVGNPETQGVDSLS